MDQSRSLYYQSEDSSSMLQTPYNSFVSTTSYSSSSTCMDMPPPALIPSSSQLATPRKLSRVTVPFPKMSAMQTLIKRRPESMRMCQSLPRSSTTRSRLNGSMRSSTPMGIRTVLKVQPTYMPQDISSVNGSSFFEESMNKSYSRCLTNGSLNTTVAHDVSLASTSISGSDIYSGSSSYSSRASSIYGSSYSRRSSSRRSSSICAKRCSVKRASSKASSKRTLSSDSGCDDGSSTASSSSYSRSSSRRSSTRSSISTDSCLEDIPARQRSYASSSSSVYSDISTPLGVRPECTGKEESPLLYRFLKDVEISLSQLNVTSSDDQSTVLSDDSTPVNTQPTCVKKPCVIDLEMYMIKRDEIPTPATPQVKLDFTALDSDWDNSELDATCTTCKSGYYSYTDSSVVSSQQEESHLHPNSLCSSAVCSSSVYSSSMYSSNSSFVPTEYTRQSVTSDSSCYSAIPSDSLYSNSSSCVSKNIPKRRKSVRFNEKNNVTVTSDMTQFMQQPLVKSPVVSKEKKKSLSKKLKQMGRYLHRLGGKSAAKDQQFKTLAVL